MSTSSQAYQSTKTLSDLKWLSGSSRVEVEVEVEEGVRYLLFSFTRNFYCWTLHFYYR